MIKRIFIGLLIIIVVLAALLVGYLFSIKVDRPTKNIQPISVLYEEKYRDSATLTEKWLEDVYRNKLVPSISISVGVHGEIVWEGVIGYSELKSGILAKQNTEYRIGSISKPMTATAVMRMQEKKIINIDNAFGTYVTDFPPQNSDFTIKQLMTHQSGVRHYINQLTEHFSTKEYASTREAASIVENDALLFLPGEGFNYSTYGYTLLSLAMEEAYSIAFENIMYKEVFLPAGMKSTELDKNRKSPNKNIATPYLQVGKSLYRSPSVNSSYKYAGGGYLSTPSDMVHFANALLKDALLSPASKKIMWTPVALSSGDMNPENYALGFRVGRDDLGRYLHHGGKSVGGYSFLLIYSELQIVVAFASNVTPSGNSIDRLGEAKKIARIFASKI